MCERLFVIQDLAWVLRNCIQNPKNTLFFADQEYPPSRIGTSHGGLSNFGSEAAKNIPPDPENENFWTKVRCTSVWILITVSPTDTI